MIKTRDKIIKASLQLGVLFLAAQLVLLGFFWKKLPPQAPLFYSHPWGKEQLTNPFGLLVLPVLSLMIILINSAVASLISAGEKLVSQLLIIFAAVFSFLCLITLFKIVILIT